MLSRNILNLCPPCLLYKMDVAFIEKNYSLPKIRYIFVKIKNSFLFYRSSITTIIPVFLSCSEESSKALHLSPKKKKKKKELKHIQSTSKRPRNDLTGKAHVIMHNATSSNPSSPPASRVEKQCCTESLFTPLFSQFLSQSQIKYNSINKHIYICIQTKFLNRDLVL